jgi:peptidylprolyl isomerase
MTTARLRTALSALCLATPGLLLAQTSSTATHRSTSSAAHRPATTATKASSAAPATATTSTAAADNPPGVPPVAAAPKPLYALRYVDTVVGEGPIATPQKWYSVKYTGWLTDGTKFDSSYDHPGQEPIAFPYGAHQVIPGWDTGFQGMRVGGKRRLYIPYQLAYGEAGRPGAIPPKSDLIFDIELVGVSDSRPTPPAAPSAEPAETNKPASTPPPSSSNPEAPAPQPQSN